MLPKIPTGYNKYRPIMKRRMIIALLSSFLLVLGGVPLGAELTPLEEDQMESVIAQAGISIELDEATFYDEYDTIEIHDSDHNNLLLLADVAIGNGSGWGYSFTTDAPLLIDVERFNRGDPLTEWMVPDWDAALVIRSSGWNQNIHYSIGNIALCGHNLGSLNIGPVTQPSFTFFLSPADDHSGLYFMHMFENSYEQIRYTYNTQGDSLAFQIITFSETFNASDPADPTTWQTSGSFMVGADTEPDDDADLARINVIKEGSSNNLMIDMDLPMKGSICIENVHMGGQDFGPIILQGIEVHEAQVRLIP